MAVKKCLAPLITLNWFGEKVFYFFTNEKVYFFVKMLHKMVLQVYFWKDKNFLTSDSLWKSIKNSWSYFHYTLSHKRRWSERYFRKVLIRVPSTSNERTTTKQTSAKVEKQLTCKVTVCIWFNLKPAHPPDVPPPSSKKKISPKVFSTP